MKRFLSLPVVFLAAACGSETEGPAVATFPLSTADKAVETYVANTFREYSACVAEATAMKTAIDAFVADPTEGNLQAARAAWVKARLTYGPSEAHRFYEGPIDNEATGVEGRLNAWPLDEFAIDYTRDTPTSGIVNDLTVTISKQTLVDEHEKAGEKSVTVGWHAIEFLLWGQDDAEPGKGAGKRPATDFQDGSSASNQARRRAYLSLVTELLIDDLKSVQEAWNASTATSFAAGFGKGGEAETKAATAKLLQALGSLAKAELSGERMTVAYKNRSQEDEHSCFSDTTSSDIRGNAQGIEQVWTGDYAGMMGAGFDEVVAAKDAALAKRISADVADAVAKTRALETLQAQGKPFDVLLAAADGSPERQSILDAITSLKVVASDMEAAGTALGLTLTLEEPSETL